MNNVLISNPSNLDDKLKRIISDGTNNFFIIADFGRTLTKCFDNGKRISTSWSSIRNQGYLGKKYKKRALEYFEKYNPIEIDSNVDLEEKIRVLTEWWKLHLELLLEFGFNLDIINDLITRGKVPLRKGVSKFLDLLKSKNIPIIIVSQGLTDIYRETIKKIRRLHENIYFMSNLFDFDENGRAIKYKGIIIHGYNKSKINLESAYFFDKIKNRKNVLLLGDGLEDLEMAKNLDYKNLVTIGFLNEKIEKNLGSFKRNFDVVILNDGDMNYVNKLIRTIK